MSDQLLASSLSRVQGDLPDFAPGADYPTKLRTGMLASGELIKKYVPGFTFDTASAEQAVRDIDAWAERNQNELSQIMATTQNDLPAALQIALGKKGVQDFLIAGFVTAAQGLGPWQSGKVAEYANAGVMVGDTRVTQEWADADARQRLQVFGLIVKLENDGKLAEIFSTEATNGLGIPIGIVIVIAIAIVALAAVICCYLYLSKRMELNNQTLREMCLKAQAEKDQRTVDECLKISQELQEGPGASFLSGLGTLALCVAGGYVAIKYVLPWVTENFVGKSEKKS